MEYANIAYTLFSLIKEGDLIPANQSKWNGNRKCKAEIPWHAISVVIFHLEK